MKRYLTAILALFLTFAVAAPATDTDLYPLEIHVSVELDTPMEEIRIGEPIRLRCVVTGLEKPYQIQWQYSMDAEEWFDLPCTEEVFEFILDEKNADMFYRVVVTLEGKDGDGIRDY